LLARSTGRAREFAIRSALGGESGAGNPPASHRKRDPRIGGGLIGLLLAKWGTRAILAALRQRCPAPKKSEIDAHVLLFTIGISFLTGILFGLVPAIKKLCVPICTKR